MPTHIHRQPNASSSLGIKKLFSLSKVEGCRNLLFSFFLPDRPFPARPRLAFTRSLHRWPHSALGFTLVAGNQLCETVGRLRSFLFHSELLNRPQFTNLRTRICCLSFWSLKFYKLLLNR